MVVLADVASRPHITFCFSSHVTFYCIRVFENAIKWGKNQLESFKSLQALQIWCRACLHRRLFEKIKKMNFIIKELKMTTRATNQSQTEKFSTKVL